MDVVKIIFNGATCSKKKKAGIGVVVLDVNGMVLASCAKIKYQPYKAVEIESLAKIKYQPYKAVEIESLAAATALSFAIGLGFQTLFWREIHRK